MAEYFKKYKSEQEEIRELLEESKKIEEAEKEWDLSDYDQYLADLYFFVGPYFHWSQEEFDNTSIDLVLYYRDKILETLENNTNDNPRSLPINYDHWSLILTMRKLFGGNKKR